MKKVMRVVAVVTLLVFGITVKAKEPKLTAEESSKSIVFNWEGSMTKSTLNFVDSDGNVIYSDYLESSADYTKKFNLKTLAEGYYYFNVKNSLREISYTVKVTEDSAFILNTDEKFKPVFKNKDGVIYINYLNVELAPIDVVVYDSFGRKLFNESLENEMLVTKVFNFKDAYSGEYSIVLKSDKEMFSETISIK